MARKGRKPEEVPNPLRRGEVPHGRGLSMADAVRLAPRNNRELPDARGRPAGRAFSPDPAEDPCRPTASISLPMRGQGARERRVDAVAGTEPGPATGARFPLCRTKPIPGRDNVRGTAGSRRSQPLPMSFGTGAACGICHYFEWEFFPSCCSTRHFDASPHPQAIVPSGF